ncbi:hypothetical protein CNQ87_01885 [Lysinibacillus fusiformis]|uniref:hypothetical protein n=1 Tax=Lysinibacillus fusiformis TaxID=28031 RepID=UPI000BBACD5D|nr:hypothetical protein [Lysinibacillus fusiformis]PCD83162.1 hypothetical protein CNQ87_01885 [Lysinibacillus fusiformis]
MNNKLLTRANRIISSEKDKIVLTSFLFGFISSLILSKEQFERNADIQKFLDSLGFQYKKYVYVSRTIILSRVIRDIEKLEENDFEKFKNDLLNYLKNEFPDVFETGSKTIKRKENKKSNDNYVSKILDKYNPK